MALFNPCDQLVTRLAAVQLIHNAKGSADNIFS